MIKYMQNMRNIIVFVKFDISLRNYRLALSNWSNGHQDVLIMRQNYETVTHDTARSPSCAYRAPWAVRNIPKLLMAPTLFTGGGPVFGRWGFTFSS
jgi:hypothetical protein